MNIARVTGALKAVRRVLQKAEHRILARVAVLGHLSYYGLVSVEAHGSYRYAAGVVGALLLIEAIAGPEGGDGHG